MRPTQDAIEDFIAAYEMQMDRRRQIDRIASEISQSSADLSNKASRIGILANESWNVFVKGYYAAKGMDY